MGFARRQCLFKHAAEYPHTHRWAPCPLEIALNILQMPSLRHLEPQVKWPNDLYSRHGKWGGILIEPLNAHQAVVGVGLNAPPVPKEGIDQAATSLTELGLAQFDRIQLTAELYLAIQQAGEWFSHDSRTSARFNHCAAFKDEAVEIEHLQGLSRGIFLGIRNDGAVEISSECDTEHFFHSACAAPARPASNEFESNPMKNLWLDIGNTRLKILDYGKWPGH